MSVTVWVIVNQGTQREIRLPTKAPQEVFQKKHHLHEYECIFIKSPKENPLLASIALMNGSQSPFLMKLSSSQCYLQPLFLPFVPSLPPNAPSASASPKILPSDNYYWWLPQHHSLSRLSVVFRPLIGHFDYFEPLFELRCAVEIEMLRS